MPAYRHIPLKRRIRDQLKQTYFTLYKLGIRLGVHLTPTHYYSPLPNILELERTVKLWARPLAMAGIAVDLDAQMATLREVCAPFAHEFRGNPHYKFAINQPFRAGRSRFFGYIEAQVLHAVIRHYRPARLIEIGGGVPSYCTSQAMMLNRRDGASGRIISIEPNPIDAIKAFPSEHFELLTRPIQDVPLDTFTGLQPNDVVFIDSNHVVKAGSEVNYTVLEILPILPKGVLVQFHDIYLPFDYDRDVLRTFLPPNETTLLAAFLACNARYKILFALSMLHYARPHEMRSVLSEYEPEANWYGMRVGGYDESKHFPSSLWLRVAE